MASMLQKVFGVPVNPIPPALYEDEWDDVVAWPNDVRLQRDDCLGRVMATRPFWFLIYDGTIGPQQTDRGQITVQEDTWLIALMASSQQAAGFAAQLFLPGEETNFQDDDVPNPNMFGNGHRPFYLINPQHIHVGDQLESRIINLATASSAIQLVGLGLRPDTRKKVT